MKISTVQIPCRLVTTTDTPPTTKCLGIARVPNVFKLNTYHYRKITKSWVLKAQIQFLIKKLIQITTKWWCEKWKIHLVSSYIMNNWQNQGGSSNLPQTDKWSKGHKGKTNSNEQSQNGQRRIDTYPKITLFLEIQSTMSKCSIPSEGYETPQQS